MPIRPWLAIALCGVPVLVGCVGPVMQAYLSDPVRPVEDRRRDDAQKASVLVDFATVKRGDVVADFVPGGGYWTRLFAAVVGQNGQIYGVNAPGDANVFDTGEANIALVETGFDEMALPRPVDVFWSARNFRDLYGRNRGEAQAAARAIFRAVKSGGHLIVIDHVASPTMPLAQQTALGRIDPELVMADVLAAGFRFDKSSAVLANPQDDHMKIIIDPAVKGRTDQFVLRFHKP